MSRKTKSACNTKGGELKTHDHNHLKYNNYKHFEPAKGRRYGYLRNNIKGEKTFNTDIIMFEVGSNFPSDVNDLQV